MDDERMRRIEEEMARFENEISAAAAAPTTDNSSASGNQSMTIAKPTGPAGGSGRLPSTATSHSMMFTPHSLRHGGGMPPPSSYSTSAMASSGAVNTAPVIEGAPSIYHKDKTKTASKATEDQPESSKPMMKTMVLPADVELLAAKKQQEVAYKNSYIGQVLRGEKKMKRFIRTAAGEVWEDTSLAEWDPNDFRIFCGDLGNEVSDELLAKAFRKYPSFQKAKVVREKRTNKSKGYGFVSFKEQQDFVRACREMDGKYVGNRPIKLRKSNWKERSFEDVKKKKKAKAKLGLTGGVE